MKPSRGGAQERRPMRVEGKINETKAKEALTGWIYYSRVRARPVGRSGPRGAKEDDKISTGNMARV